MTYQLPILYRNDSVTLSVAGHSPVKTSGICRDGGVNSPLTSNGAYEVDE